MTPHPWVITGNISLGANTKQRVLLGFFIHFSAQLLCCFVQIFIFQIIVSREGASACLSKLDRVESGELQLGLEALDCHRW